MSDENVADRGLPRLGDRIRAARVERGIAPADLARRAQISRSYLHALETGPVATRPMPTAAILLRIARQLGVSIAELVDEEGAARRVAFDEIPAGLREAATELRLTDDEVGRLASIKFRGRQPQSAVRWKLLITQLQLTEPLDEADPTRGT